MGYLDVELVVDEEIAGLWRDEGDEKRIRKEKEV